VEIEVDGKNVLNGHKLIVNGNEDQEVKGFMKDMNNTNRFKFIHKTKDIQEYRGDKIDDGLVRVTYQYEKYKPEPISLTYIDQPVYTCRLNNNNNNYDIFTYSYGSVSSSLDCRGMPSSISYPPPLSDEGITVKGDKINQNYNYGNIDSLESNIYTIVLHLKGLTKNKRMVQKPITIKSKLKCSICGRNNKSFNKFCFNCGTFLE